DSILTLWLKFPEIDQKNGKISFIGGIPGGYCSLNAQKDTPNLLLKVAFRPKKSSKGIAFVEFEKDSEVLLNDGKATPAKLSFKEAKFEIFSQFPETPKKEWEEELAKDTVLPEPFEIEIHRDPSVFEGKYFIVFFTTDKQTGIDHYEIKEGERDWKLAKSPYLLEDQSLKSKILVKAVDKAGNERIVEFNPYQKRNFNWFLVSILFLIAILITWYFINKAVIKVEK
ncbi:hypothetical protein H5T58_01750, partial [Candidatus Parcubacteria bacterium]|nr:hypothetical protein [Candidatus Parcubacteria bacterium]